MGETIKNKTHHPLRPKNKWQGECVGIITLGCARNTVDSEKLISDVVSWGAKFSPVSKASTVLVNTCAFTKDSKEESLDVILSLIELKKKGKLKRIVVCGCLSERYEKELKENFQEVDDFIGIADFKKSFDGPVMLTFSHYAYLKISEGCANMCSYCAIPNIKGGLRSRSEVSILDEARYLEGKGVRELNIIGQDITLFGRDKALQKPGVGLPLTKLLRKIIKETSIPWIRLLYLHPKRISEDLIDLIASQNRICPYIDIPLQHVNNRILKLMNRDITKEEIIALIENLKNRIPAIALRTAFIVGFPSESKAEFCELLEFVKTVRFDRLGAFMYSREEGTKAYSFGGQISKDTKQVRYNEIMSLQKEISKKLQKKELGRVFDVIIDEDKTKSDKIYIGRSQKDAPEVDGVIFLKSSKKLRCGAIVKARIMDSYEYDLVGEVLNKVGY